MRFLFIEDDEVKRERVGSFLHTRYPMVEVETRNSVQSGLRSILSGVPTLVILDMNLPNYDQTPSESGGRLFQFGGRELLRQVQRRKLAVPMIVVTQLDYFEEVHGIMTLAQLDAELKRRFPTNYVGKVYYHTSNDDWATELANYIDATLKLGVKGV